MSKRVLQLDNDDSISSSFSLSEDPTHQLFWIIYIASHLFNPVLAVTWLGKWYLSHYPHCNSFSCNMFAKNILQTTFVINLLMGDFFPSEWSTVHKFLISFLLNYCILLVNLFCSSYESNTYFGFSFGILSVHSILNSQPKLMGLKELLQVTT